jgi:multiple antibiotic resistance protein
VAVASPLISEERPLTLLRGNGVLPWDELTKFLVALIVIVNPLGAVPVYLTVVGNQTAAQHDRNARIAAITVVATLMVAILAGQKVLGFFAIGLPSFRVGGGIVILLMAIAMLRGETGSIRHTTVETEEAIEKEAVAAVPIGIPLLAGPGAISTAIVAAHDSTGWLYTLVLCVGALVLAPLLWACLRFAVPIGGYLGRTGINISTRLMGLILMAIAVEFIAGGLKQLFPALA